MPSAVAPAEVTPPDPGGDAVRQVVGRYVGRIKSCYEQRLAEKPDLAGRVEITWALDAGAVTSAAVSLDTTGDAELGTCIVDKLKSWTFPEAVTGEFTWPFVFKPNPPTEPSP